MILCPRTYARLYNTEVHKTFSKKNRSGTFASFFLDNTEFAITLDYVQEVVNYPEKVSLLPLGPEFLDGVFNLRGMVIPIINLRKLLEVEGAVDSADMKIAIISFDSTRVGLLFDSTGTIVSPHSDERNDYTYNEGSDYKIISGAIKIESGARLLQILDPKALVSLKNIPQLPDSLDEDQTQAIERVQGKNIKKCIKFTASGVRFAFEMTEIYEILTVGEIQQNPWVSQLCMGMIITRNRAVPVINFAELLGKPQEDGDPSARRIIVLKLEQDLFGILVDHVESISSYSSDDLLTAPILSISKVDMFRGSINLKDDGDVYLIDLKKIFAIDDLLQIARGHTTVYKAESIDELKTKNQKRQAYLSFILDQRFGFSISEVKEVINYDEKIMHAPGMPDFVAGTLNHRGKLVTIVDARLLYKIEAPDTRKKTDKKIIVIGSTGDFFGLLVDDIEGIVNGEPGSNYKLPKMFSDGVSNTFIEDSRDVIKTAKFGPLIVLKVQSIIERIKNGRK